MVKRKALRKAKQVRGTVRGTAFDRTLWYAPIDLATALGVTRLTIYRWMATDRVVDIERFGPRCVRVRLRPRSSLRGTSVKGRQGRRRAV